MAVSEERIREEELVVLQPSPERCHTIDGLLRLLALDPEDPPLVAYPADGIADFEEYTAKDLDRFADAAVARYINSGLEPADPTLKEAPVVAILAQGSFEVIVSMFALNRLGWAIFFLSPRLATAAYVQLLEKTKCQTIITTDNLCDTVQKIQIEKQIISVPLIAKESYREIVAQRFQRSCNPIEESLKIAWILHSSGSTGVPKPIFMTNFGCLANIQQNYSLKSFCASPLYHTHGVMSLFRCIYSKKTMYICNWAFPVTRHNLAEAMKVCKPELVCAVPYVLKLLAESETGLQLLANAKLVLYAGSSCPQALGDLLVSRGVNLGGNYGATETGYIMNSIRARGEDKEDWNYLRLRPPNDAFTLMDEVSPGIFECVALEGTPAKNISNSDDPPNSFRTRDVFQRHPDPRKANFWKYLSRLDDRITLVTGEKILPVPMESRIRIHHLIKDALIFGVGKTVPGVLLIRSEDANTMTEEDIVDMTWPVIEAANAAAETFSQIPRELVVVLPPNIKYPQTPKQTIVRSQAYEQLANFIETAYDQFETGCTGNLQLSVTEIENFLMEKFRAQIPRGLVSVESDIFTAGVDSLQTTRIWSIIKKELDLGGRQAELSQNIVFERGNVRNLAKYLYHFRFHEEEKENTDEIEQMRDMVDRYSKFKRQGRCVFLITGTTGSLGAFLLADALRRDHVSAVWTIVRASTPSDAAQRVHHSLSSRGLKITDEEKSKIIALPGDFSQASLGLSLLDRQSLLSSLTHVIHAAWAVNFNLGLASFESQHVGGLYNLLNTCLSVYRPAPAEMYFCSSVSVADGGSGLTKIPEKIMDQLSDAQNMGYAQSKMVAEHIVRNAMMSTDIYARVLRIGQIVGDAETGYWNETEATPLMIRAMLTVGALPALDEIHSWLPVDICARSILDIALSNVTNSHGGPSAIDKDPDLIYNICNPKAFHWTKDFLPALRRTDIPRFEILSVKEWIKKLRTSDSDPVKNPTFKLIDYWEKKYFHKGSSGVLEEKTPDKIAGAETQGDEALDVPNFKVEMSRTLLAAPRLAQAPDLIGEGYVEKFVAGWLARWGI